MSKLFPDSDTLYLPQSDDSIRIFRPSEPHKPYRPAIPPPPRGAPFDIAGFKVRINYCENIRARRKISPRTMGFIQNIKYQCANLLQGKGSKKDREAQINKLRIDEDMLHSRFDEVRGPWGLCEMLIRNAALIADVRLKVEYGDHLAISLTKLKEERFGGFQWKLDPRLDWVDVAEILTKEKEQRDRFLDSANLRRPETPWLDDIHKAANKLGVSEDQLIYEITWYAKRNEFCHSGIKRMIEETDWGNLANRIIMDNMSLCAMYQGRPQEQIKMRNCIAGIEREWFRVCYLHNGAPKYILTEKGLEKEARRGRQQRAEASNP